MQDVLYMSVGLIARRNFWDVSEGACCRGRQGAVSDFRSVQVSDGPLFAAKKWRKSVRGTPPNTPDFSGAGSILHQKGKHPFGMYSPTVDGSLSSAPAGPRGGKSPDLVICAAE